MAASSKFDFSSSSSDGPTHQNGQRGPHAAASLERPGSFREGLENRIQSSVPSTLRSGSISCQGDASSLLQSIVSDLKAVVSDQKLPRQGEIRRLLTSILGTSTEDSLPATVNTRPLTSSMVEEIKRVKNYLQESSVKARDRARTFCDAVSKMDKCYHNWSRKRSRAENSSGERSNITLPGGNNAKVGPQSHLTAGGLENGPQKSEEKAKNTVPSRRIRTSLVDVRMDARANGIARPSGSVDRDRDVFKLVNGGATPLEEKGRALPTVVDGWEKSKMKKKRSVIKSDASGSVVSARSQDGDREAKRGMQQKLISDARPRLNNTHGVRSVPAGVTGAGRLDSASQPNGISMRPFPRNDQENGLLPNDRRERLVGLDKEGGTNKSATKPNSREDNYAASPTSMMKINASARGPRSNSGSLSKGASPNINRGLGNSDDWDHPQSMNKLSGVGGAVNRKRSTSTRSSSPPVAQWVGQRPQKITRVARRSNLPPVISSRDEHPASEIHDNATNNDDGLGCTRRMSSNASQQSKSKGDHALSAGLSESEESGIVDNKSKDKGKKSNDIEEKTGSSVQKAANLVLPSRKSKVAAEEDLEDGMRRHTKIGRGVTPSRSGMPIAIEKLDNAGTAKQIRSARTNHEKIESKLGRPPTKKWSERKGQTRPRAGNGASFEFAGESDDDHEELLAAAKAALSTRQACSGSFWKQTEEIFGFLSAEDRNFLKQQIRLADDAAASTCSAGDGQGLKGHLEHSSLPSTPTLSTKDGYRLNGLTSLNEHESDGRASQMKHVEPFLKEIIQGMGPQNGVSICQALLSAIIEEEEVENVNYIKSKEEDCLYDSIYGIHLEESKLKGSSFQTLGTFQASERGALKANAAWRYHDELINEDLRSNAPLEELLPNLTTTSSTICTDFQYNQMCMNDRILLELNEIGLHPEPVPYLAQSEDEDIGEGINRLEEKLHEKIMKKRRLLQQLEKAVTEASEPQRRDFERMALDRLIGMAYEKYMVCWGPNATGSKNMNRTNKQAVLAFVRRTLTRYRRFEETGTSCFSEPAFRDMLLSVSSDNGDVENTDVFANAVAAHRFTSARNSDISLTDQNHDLAAHSTQRIDIHDKYSDAFRSVNHLTEQTCGREDQWSNKLKRKELLLDDVCGAAPAASLRAPSGLGSSLVSSTKGKRSERDRDGKGQIRDSASRNGTAKIGRPALSNTKGERKNKSKPKQKLTQLSASVNGLIGKATEIPNKISPSTPKPREIVGGNAKKDESTLRSSYVGGQELSNDAEAVDFCNLQLPEIDVGDFGGQGQDIGSWLNIEEDGLQDHDFMGLEIPMDDLSEVNMMI